MFGEGWRNWNSRPPLTGMEHAVATVGNLHCLREVSVHSLGEAAVPFYRFAHKECKDTFSKRLVHEHP